MKTLLSLLSIVLVLHSPALSESQDPAVKAIEKKTVQARPLPLDSVRLLGGPLMRAQDVTAEYLLQLEPDRMLAGYRIRAGLDLSYKFEHRSFIEPLKRHKDVLEGKAKVTVRFEAQEGNSIASVFGIRMIRADAER